MEKEKLDLILCDHNKWLRSEGGQRADLRGADLRGADLSGADLSGADLSGADLSGADLSRADLSWANLSGANLSWANLSGANLSWANLSGANLRGTCLSIILLQFARGFSKECPPTKHGGRIVYRTAYSEYIGSTEYKVGHTYIADHLSWSVETGCHPGIYAGSLQWMRKYYSTSDLVRCYVRDGEWAITAKGCIRCARIRVLSKVKED